MPRLALWSTQVHENPISLEVLEDRLYNSA